MQKASRDFILNILDQARDLTIATNRADGWPQATTVSFVHDGLLIYFGVGAEGQKAKNIARDKRVSIVVDVPCSNWQEIKGLSMAAWAQVLTRPAEIKRALALLARKFPAMADLSEEDLAATAAVKVTPKVVSVIDYTKGFGHSELVKV